RSRHGGPAGRGDRSRRGDPSAHRGLFRGPALVPSLRRAQSRFFAQPCHAPPHRHRACCRVVLLRRPALQPRLPRIHRPWLPRIPPPRPPPPPPRGPPPRLPLQARRRPPPCPPLARPARAQGPRPP